MSVSLNVRAYLSKENKEFQKHFKAVKFCIENGLSFPKETSSFFNGKLGRYDLEDINTEYILKYIERGVEVPLKTIINNYIERGVEVPLKTIVNNGGDEITIKVSEIPIDVDIIVIKLS